MPRPSADEAALLKAVCRSPADDLPRLVYADWLDEHGRPERAEFIRLQIAAARGPDADDDFPGITKFHRLERLAALSDTHAASWLRELPKWVRERYEQPDADRPEFERGFVSDFTVTASLFARYGPQLLDRTPVRRLHLEHCPNVIVDLARCVWLREVPVIALNGHDWTDDHFRTLADSPWLAGTRKLDLTHLGMRDGGAIALARCHHFAALEELDLTGNELTLAGVRALAKSPYLRTVRRIELRWNNHLNDYQDEVAALLGRRLADPASRRY